MNYVAMVLVTIGAFLLSIISYKRGYAEGHIEGWWKRGKWGEETDVCTDLRTEDEIEW